jgi:Ca-activated chloride channel family protein
MYEYTNVLFSIFGAVALVIWSVEYWNVFKRGQLVISKGAFGSRLIIRRLIIFMIGIVAWGCITFSLTGPRTPLGLVKDDIEVNDVTFVVDVSRSMLATDFNPNRLEVAKKRILEFIKLRPRDRIAIIIFSEKVFTLLPLTTDLELIDRVVPQIRPGFLGSGTNIGDAIGLAVGRGLQSIAKSKIIILLTDGVSNVGMITPLEAANRAKESGIKVYTIGVGGKGDAKIPVPKNLTGGRLIYQTIPGGSVDFGILKTISKITNGKNYVARDGSALGDVLKEIELLERTKVDVTGHVIYKEQYLFFVIVGVGLLLFAEISRRLFIREAI